MTENSVDMDKVNDLFDDLDKVLDKHIKDYEMSFLEIDTALMLVKKKIAYEETSSWLQFMIAGIQEEQTNDSSSKTQSEPNGDMYG
jgi:hypothetical protein